MFRRRSSIFALLLQCRSRSISAPVACQRISESEECRAQQHYIFQQEPARSGKSREAAETLLPARKRKQKSKCRQESEHRQHTTDRRQLWRERTNCDKYCRGQFSYANNVRGCLQTESFVHPAHEWTSLNESLDARSFICSKLHRPNPAQYQNQAVSNKE